MRNLILYFLLANILSVPFCTGQADSLYNSRKHPVILVPGLLDKASRMKHIAQYLSVYGWKTYPVTLAPSTGRIGIDELALQLEEFVKNNFKPDQKLDLVGFSMGGLVCRYYIQRLGGLSRTDHFIEISSPDNGTLMAYMLNNKGAKQMRFKSSFLTDLKRDEEMLNQLKITSLWTPLDLSVVPASSSILKTGNDVKIWCPLHFLMVYNRTIHGSD